MMRLDTNPTRPAPTAGRWSADPLPVLIEVPRIATERGRIPTRRPSQAYPMGSPRTDGRPRRRLRRGVRRVLGALPVLFAMAGTFALGWTSGGGAFHPVPVVAARDAGISIPEAVPALFEAPADGLATDAVLGAPVADVEVPVAFPGYLLPDNTREEPVHEGS